MMARIVDGCTGFPQDSWEGGGGFGLVREQTGGYVAGHEQNFATWVILGIETADLKPVHEGHENVGDERMGMQHVAGDKRLPGIVAGDNLRAMLFQDGGERELAITGSSSTTTTRRYAGSFCIKLPLCSGPYGVLL